MLTIYHESLGYFDLDPTRVLDLVLESFTSNIMTHCQFFIELLRKWTSRSNELELVGNSACAQILGFKFENLQVLVRTQITFSRTCC